MALVRLQARQVRPDPEDPAIRANQPGLVDQVVRSDPMRLARPEALQARQGRAHLVGRGCRPLDSACEWRDTAQRRDPPGPRRRR